MITRDEKLRRVSDGILQEAEPPEDRRRPLEWHLSFKFICLPLKNIEIVTSCFFAEADFEWEEVKESRVVNANIYDQIAITGIVDQEKMRDSLYYATIEDNEDKDVVFAENVPGNTNVTIKLKFLRPVVTTRLWKARIH